jgi:hypothetical protein
MRRLFLAAALAILALPSVGADDTRADPSSPAGVLGALIVNTAAGRSWDEAYGATKSDRNPYGLDEKALLKAAGATRLSQDMTGSAIKAGELSVLPQFNTPGGKFSANLDTPPMIPFAFLRKGVCQAGYVRGFPAPTETWTVALDGRPCSAYSVEDIKFADYQVIQEAIDNAPRALSDADLELLVRAAYTAAVTHSAAHGNYFAKDGTFGELRDAVAAGIVEFKGVVVQETPAESLEAARQCLAAVGTEVRVATTEKGDGVSLVATTDGRTFSYDYDPHESTGVEVAPAADCIAP